MNWVKFMPRIFILIGEGKKPGPSKPKDHLSICARICDLNTET